MPCPLPSEVTLEEARMRSAQYRQMAAAASTPDVQDLLIRLAERYEGTARDWREWHASPGMQALGG